MPTTPTGSSDRSPQGVNKITRKTSESDRQMSLTPANSKSVSLKGQSTTDFDHQRWLFESKGKYGIGNACWQDDGNVDKKEGTTFANFMDKPWKPLTRKTLVPASVLSPYRLGGIIGGLSELVTGQNWAY